MTEASNKIEEKTNHEIKADIKKKCKVKTTMIKQREKQRQINA